MNPPCQPFTQCWCEQHPGHPKCQTDIPINNGLIFLLLAGLVLGVMRYKN